MRNPDEDRPMVCAKDVGIGWTSAPAQAFGSSGSGSRDRSPQAGVSADRSRCPSARYSRTTGVAGRRAAVHGARSATASTGLPSTFSSTAPAGNGGRAVAAGPPARRLATSRPVSTSRRRRSLIAGVSACTAIPNGAKAADSPRVSPVSSGVTLTVRSFAPRATRRRSSTRLLARRLLSSTRPPPASPAPPPMRRRS
jgi:hypothetical protein